MVLVDGDDVEAEALGRDELIDVGFVFVGALKAHGLSAKASKSDFSAQL
jgi:hypothetical protein